MPSSKADETFYITSISGSQYEITFRQAMSWIKSWRFYVFFVLANIALIAFAPHNKPYGLEVADRFLFWPIISSEYVIVYIIAMWIGSRYASSKEGRVYYTPYGFLVGSIVGTYSGAFLLSYLTGAEPDLSIYKAMEVFFNLLFGSLFEVIFFAYCVKDINKTGKKGPQHEWEMF